MLNARAAAFHQLLDFILARHAGVAGRGKNPTGMQPADAELAEAVIPIKISAKDGELVFQRK